MPDEVRLLVTVYAVVTVWLFALTLLWTGRVWHDAERRDVRLFIGICLTFGWPLAPIGALALALDRACAWWKGRRLADEDGNVRPVP